MSSNPNLSEEEMQALLDPRRDEPGLPAVASQESELLHALKNVVKSLTVRVASLESEVGRLRAELAASRRGGELPPVEERIVVEGVMLPALPAEREAAAAAEAERGTGAAAAAVIPAFKTGGDVSARAEEPYGHGSLPQLQPGAADAAALAPRSVRHRKPKKKGFFSRLFE